MKHRYNSTIYKLFFVLVTIILLSTVRVFAKDFTETSFTIARVNPLLLESKKFIDFMESNNRLGIEVTVFEKNRQVFFTTGNRDFNFLAHWLNECIEKDSTRIVPVFLNYSGLLSVLDSVIANSEISSSVFFLPHGETWPPLEHLIDANRRILFFVSGETELPGKNVHRTVDYIHRISAVPGSRYDNKSNLELLAVLDFDRLPVSASTTGNFRNLVPDYINFLLQSWTKYGKRPNFIFVGEDFQKFDFILPQLSSFTWINGIIRGLGKTLERVYWRNPEISITGGKFSFPYRGGDELTLTPFVPGYGMTPEQIIVTGEMEVPESYHIIAEPLKIDDGLTGSFYFDETIRNNISPSKQYEGENFSFIRDIEREMVLKLPENSSVNLGSPELYGLRNSSFTVSCFVKFYEILESGDNAILGNFETEYRRGLHLILRSGHPYFGLWENDFVSEEKLQPNVWYHLVWRYIIETGEQAIFLNGQNIGSSDGHPPFSGTGEIHLGSALSQGANLHGYIDNLYIWSRPLGVDEIVRLAMDEPVVVESVSEPVSGVKKPIFSSELLIVFAFVTLIIAALLLFIFRKSRKPEHPAPVHISPAGNFNRINLFGGFQAFDREGNDISARFTPKVKELFLFIFLATLKNKQGAAVSDVDRQLWFGLPAKKIINNRAVTLNKLRNILQLMDGIQISTIEGFLQAQMQEPFSCDYAEVYRLCNIPGGMNKKQLETFYELTRKGAFLQGLNWEWLDEILGFTETLVIDNLLKLALFFKSEGKIAEIDNLAKRILEYDEMNEEAVWLQVWVLRQTNNAHQARFRFESFASRYKENLNEDYPYDFDEFNRQFSDIL